MNFFKRQTNGFASGTCRLWWLGCATSFVWLFSCTNVDVTSPDPEIVSVDPVSVLASVRTPATIKGENLLGRIRGQVDREGPTIDKQFRVIIGDVEVALEDVTFVDTETLNIIVPSGLALDVHDLIVITPGGRSATLPQALTVIEETTDVTCDGIDGDGDGMVDEGYVPDSSCFLPGVCAAGNLASSCTAGIETDCATGAPSGISETICNGDDDDCSGATDEDYVPDNSCFLPGVCAAGNLASSCAAGVETDCTTGAPSGISETICNGDDDDCNDATDEGYVPDSSCFLPGVCAAGNLASSCTAGIETDCATGAPSGISETICNGDDDDCDTFVDEDLVLDGGAYRMACSNGIADCYDYITSVEYAGEGDGLYWIDPVAEWLNRTQITFNNTNSAVNLIDFPVLVTLTTDDIDFDKIKADGADIRFIDDDGTLLAYEIESWNDTTGSESAIVWVKVQQIDQESNSDFIWLYYNNSDASDGQNAAGVWSAGTGVYHLDEDPGPGGVGDIKDSNGSANNGTAESSMTTGDLVTGKIGDAIDFDGNDDFIDFASTDMGDTFTIEVWINPDSGSTTIQSIAANSEGGSATDGFRFFINSSGTNDGKIIFETGNGSSGGTASTTVGVVNFDQWNYITVKVDRTGGLATIYHNGVDATDDSSIRNDFNTSSDWEIGRMESGELQFTGAIDEFRVANVARSADWVEASYLSQNGTFTFNTFGIEEAVSGGPSSQYKAYCDMTTDGGGWTLNLDQSLDDNMPTPNLDSTDGFINQGINTNATEVMVYYASEWTNYTPIEERYKFSRPADFTLWGINNSDAMPTVTNLETSITTINSTLYYGQWDFADNACGVWEPDPPTASWGRLSLCIGGGNGTSFDNFPFLNGQAVSDNNDNCSLSAESWNTQACTDTRFFVLFER